MKSGLFLSWSLLLGLFLLNSNTEGARATSLILGKIKPEPKIDVLPAPEEEIEEIAVGVNGTLANLNETASAGNVTKLTGIPQIDYIYDPNLPRELNGYNLTDYPFYNSVPEDIDFKCDGLHDGFYASVPHKCQVYHHCLFGTRYDFLCANYTAFDQKTFICHFASEVDCKNSPRYFNRNEALYKATTTTTAAPLSFWARRPSGESPGGRRRARPHRKKKPTYEYYDEPEDFSESDYYDEGSSRRKRPRPQSGRDSFDQTEGEDDAGDDEDKALSPTGPNKSVFDRPRVAPKIRRPVPVNERDKYDYSSDSRAIVKEPTVEKKRFEETETSKKQINNQYESSGSYSKNSETSDSERDKKRVYKQEDGYQGEREREKDRENEKKRDRDRERERERERERDREDRPYRDRRPHKKRRRPEDIEDEYYDYEDSRRYRPPSRNRPRYDDYDDYEYDERPYRRNRDQEYRVRQHDYDRDQFYRSRDYDYDRPRNRERLREDERPDRLRDEDRQVRNREVDDRPSRVRESDDRPVRNRDQDRNFDDRLTKSRNEQQSFRNSGKSGSQSGKNKESSDGRHEYSDENDRFRDGGAEEENLKVKETYDESLSTVPDEKEKDDRRYAHKGSEGQYKQEDGNKHIERGQERNKNQEKPPRYRDNLEKTFKSRGVPNRKVPVDDEPKKPETFIRTRPVEVTDRPKGNAEAAIESSKPNAGQRNRFSGQFLPTAPEDATTEEQNKPVPATRPAYITRPPDAVLPIQPFTRKPFVESNVQKSNGIKRPLQMRIPLVEEGHQTEPLRNPAVSVSGYEQYDDRSKVEEDEEDKISYGTQVEKIQPEKNDNSGQLEETSVDLMPQKFRVPQEDPEFNGDTLAPRAPKIPQTIRRRRPFLPSRNGNANLPRGLQPVGEKAVHTPRGLASQNKKVEEIPTEIKMDSSGENNRDVKPDSRYRVPQTNTGVEFRAKLSTAIGVDQPKLTQYFQDVQSSSELELPPVDYSDNPQFPPSSTAVEADYYGNEEQKQEKTPATQNFGFSYQDRQPPRQLDGPHGSVFPQEPHHSQRVAEEHKSSFHETQPHRNPEVPLAQDLSGTRNVPGYGPDTQQGFRQETNFNFRQTLRPTEYSRLNEAPVLPAHHSSQGTQHEVQENRQVESLFRGRHQVPRLIGHQTPVNHFMHKNPPVIFPSSSLPQSKPESSHPQLSPPSFYSENPKFKTTVKVPSQFPFQAMSGQTINYSMGLHLPTLQTNIRQAPQRQVESHHESLKFPGQNENLDESDEYDVSLNDALQPVSSLHPRNVATGIFYSNGLRNDQKMIGLRRRIHQGSNSGGDDGQQEYSNDGSRSREESQGHHQQQPSGDPETHLAQRGVQESRNVPTQGRRFVGHREAASNLQPKFILPPLYQQNRHINSPANYVAILTQ